MAGVLLGTLFSGSGSSSSGTDAPPFTLASLDSTPGSGAALDDCLQLVGGGGEEAEAAAEEAAAEGDEGALEPGGEGARLPAACVLCN